MGHSGGSLVARDLEGGQAAIAATERAPRWLSLAAVLTLAWLQPLLLHRTGIPAASILIVLMGIAALVDQVARRSMLPLLIGPTVLCYVGLVWATFVTFSGSSVENLTVWLTLFVAVIVGPWVSVGSQPWTGYAIVLSAKVGLSIAVVAVFLERHVSTTLFGIITESQNRDRSTALAANPNAGGLFIMIGILLIVGLGRTHSRGRRAQVLQALLVIAGLWALLQTGSRGAILGLGGAVVIGLVLYSGQGGQFSKSLRYRAMAVLLTAGFFAYYLELWPRQVQQYLDGQARLDSANDRLAIWRAALAVINQHPVLGDSQFTVQGFGVNNAHNTVLEAAIRYGVPGCIILLLLYGAFLVLFYKALGMSDSAWTGFLLTVATGIYSLSHTGILDSTFIWVVLGALAFDAQARAKVRTACGADVVARRPRHEVLLRGRPEPTEPGSRQG